MQVVLSIYENSAPYVHSTVYCSHSQCKISCEKSTFASHSVYLSCTLEPGGANVLLKDARGAKPKVFCTRSCLINTEGALRCECNSGCDLYNCGKSCLERYTLKDAVTDSAYIG